MAWFSSLICMYSSRNITYVSVIMIIIISRVFCPFFIYCFLGFHFYWRMILSFFIVRHPPCLSICRWNKKRWSNAVMSIKWRCNLRLGRKKCVFFFYIWHNHNTIIAIAIRINNGHHHCQSGAAACCRISTLHLIMIIIKMMMI